MGIQGLAGIVALALLCGTAAAQDTAAGATGFLNQSVTVDGQEHRYALYVPREYDAARAWPLVVFLHGAGERGADGLKQTEVGIGRAIRLNPERFPCLVLMPQCPDNKFWDTMFPAMEAMMARTKTGYTVDEKRVTLTGLSLGGYGTWLWGSMRTDIFAALMPVCGGGNPMDLKRLSPDMTPESFGTMEERVARLATRPVWAFHGKADDVVPALRTRQMVRNVEKAGGTVKYTEYPEVGHNSWDNAYGDAEAVAWLLEQRLP